MLGVRNLYVPLPEPALERLRELARRELRDTKAQAAYFILAGLAQDEATRVAAVRPRRRARGFSNGGES